MNIITFVLAWIVSILGMTFFSAIWSMLTKNQFREPQLLSEILDKHPEKASSHTNSIMLGWLIHIILGAVFLGIYEILWKVTGFERTLLWGLVFGSLLGFIGILGWKLMFSAVNYSSHFKYGQYYSHLYLAHLVFSVLALIVYRWMN